LILVDSSVWIDFLSSSPSGAGVELRRMITDAEPLALAGVIVTEVLQGLRRDVSRIEGYLSQWDMLEPTGFQTYRQAAVIFKAARSKVRP
jgi:predicted nucleic acid-binding protein